MASKLDLTVSRIPDGAYMAVLDKADGTRVTRENITFSASKATVSFTSVNAGETIKGYIDDGQNIVTRAAYLEGVTMADTLSGYDNIIGVGDSITQGEFSLCKMIATPYRGVEFSSAAVYGTTLATILSTISTFSALAKTGKKNLFIVRAGMNDVNTLMSANGLQDGASGTVLSYSDLTQLQIDTAKQQYRDIVAALAPHGDVALATLTWADAKGQLLPLPDKGASKHSGSWNDNLLNAMCQELTPSFYNSTTNRPTFDYYTATINASSTIDADNLHFYDDFKYPSTTIGSAGEEGTWTVRKVMLDELKRIQTIPLTPYDSSLFKDRVLINFGNASSYADKVPYSDYTNNFTAASGVTNADLRSFVDANSATSGYSITSTSSHSPTFRSNMTHDAMSWDEGVASPRIAASCMSVQKSRTLSFEVNAVGSGVMTFICRFESLGVAGNYVTAVTVTDDNGATVHTVDNADVTDTASGAINAMKTANYDATNTGKVVVSLEAVGTSTHGGICGINFDINK